MIYDTLIEKSSDDELLQDCWGTYDVNENSLLEKEKKWCFKLISADSFYKKLNPESKKKIEKLIFLIESKIPVIGSSGKPLNAYFRLFISYELAKVIIYRPEFPLEFISSIVIYSGIKLRKGFSEAGCVLTKGSKKNLFYLNQVHKGIGLMSNYITILAAYYNQDLAYKKQVTQHKKWSQELHLIIEIIEKDRLKLKEKKVIKTVEKLLGEFSSLEETYFSTLTKIGTLENIDIIKSVYKNIIMLLSSFLRDKEELYLENKTSIHLSWYHLLQSYQINQNLMVHEFAHVLDYYNSGLNGVGSTEFKHKEVWAKNYNFETENHELSIISPYGLSNELEFFAVCSEHFFVDKNKLKTHLPEIYDSLKRIYKFEPPMQTKISNWSLFKSLFFSKVRFFKLPAINTK